MYQGGTAAARFKAAGPPLGSGHSGTFAASVRRRQPRPALEQ